MTLYRSNLIYSKTKKQTNKKTNAYICAIMYFAATLTFHFRIFVFKLPYLCVNLTNLGPFYFFCFTTSLMLKKQKQKKTYFLWKRWMQEE